MLTNAEVIEWAEKWATLLETTDKPQAQEYLWRMDSAGNVGFCCLGILCVATNENMPKAKSAFFHGGTYSLQDRPSEITQPIAEQIQRTLEEIAHVYDYTVRGSEFLFVFMNDQLKMSFKEIAVEVRHAIELLRAAGARKWPPTLLI